MIKKSDAWYMQQALKQAEKAYLKNEVPIGAIVVDPDGNIVGRGYNKTELNNSQTDHAEAIAIKKACKKIGDWRLNGYRIYVTLEPCLMCFGLIQLSRIQLIAYGSKSTLFGVGLDNIDELPFYSKKITVKKDIEKDQCLGLLKKFFKKLRTKSLKRKDQREAKGKIS